MVLVCRNRKYYQATVNERRRKNVKLCGKNQSEERRIYKKKFTTHVSNILFPSFYSHHQDVSRFITLFFVTAFHTCQFVSLESMSETIKKMSLLM